MNRSEMQVLLTAVVLCFCASVRGTLVEWPISEGGNGHFYEAIAVPTGITWTDAREAANSAGGYLATVTSQAENDFVFGLVDDEAFWFTWVSLQGPWLGGYQPFGSN